MGVKRGSSLSARKKHKLEYNRKRYWKDRKYYLKYKYKIRKWKKVRGICVWCPCKAIKDKVLCKDCSKKGAMYVRQRSKQNWEQGICLRCPNLRCKGKRYCLYHIKIRSDEDSSRYQIRRDKGLCNSCGNRAIIGKVLCSVCRVKDKSRYIKVRRKLHEKRKKLGLCTECGYAAVKGIVRCEFHNRQRNELTIKRNRSIKEAIVKLYGGKCNCCNEREIKFLGIDHVYNDGKKERLELSKNRGWGCTYMLYRKILKEGKSGRYQILCMNCNFSKGQWGKCPHKELRRVCNG